MSRDEPPHTTDGESEALVNCAQAICSARDEFRRLIRRYRSGEAGRKARRALASPWGRTPVDGAIEPTWNGMRGAEMIDQAALELRELWNRAESYDDKEFAMSLVDELLDGIETARTLGRSRVRR